MLLQIDKVTVSLQGETILHTLSLEVREGEFLSLLGPSGCGKSTLLKSIAGIHPVQSGSILLAGQDITHTPVHKRPTVILFQDMRLFPNMSVLENVAFPLKMQRIPKAQRLETAKEFLQKVQMLDYSSRRVDKLSGGQQQRVALARALAAKPKVLLLDEPFSALDENLREEMRALVLQLHRSLKMTTILVTHDRSEALSMADRVAVMFDGSIAQCGTPQQVYEQPVSRSVADYFGNCTYLSGTIHQHQFYSNAKGIAIAAPHSLADGNYTLMLRSYALHPEQPGDFLVVVESLRYEGARTVATFRHEQLRFEKSYDSPSALREGQQLHCFLDTSGAVFFPQD